MIDLVAAATKKGYIEPGGKKLPITGDARPLNTAILIGIYCIGHPTACWANDPESVESLWYIKKSSDVKIIIEMANPLSLNGHSYPEIWVTRDFLFFK